MTSRQNITIEPLLDPRNAREHLLPIIHNDLWTMYRVAKASFWSAEEIDLTDDLAHWESLDVDEKAFMKTIFAFLAVFDQLVIKHLETDFVSKITIPEAQMFYRYQEAMEDIHVHMYSLFPDRFIKDETERNRILDGIRTIPSIGRMVDWAKRTSSLSFAQRLVAFIIVEGVFFSSIFAAIFYMKKKGKLPGVCQSNEFIARDEGQHRDFGLLLFSKLIARPSDQEIITMMNEAIELVIAFNREAAPVSMIGMNSGLMDQYVKFVADKAATGGVIQLKDGSGLIIPGLLGRPIYGVNNPFEWMNMISMEGKTNFFDRGVSQYSRSSILSRPEDNTVRLDAAF